MTRNDDLLRKAVEYGYQRGQADVTYSRGYRPTLAAANFVSENIDSATLDAARLSHDRGADAETCPLCDGVGTVRWNEKGYVPAPTLPALDPLALAMNDAYTYEDDDNAVPTLPFIDDAEAFWRPFAVKVREALRDAV